MVKKKKVYKGNREVILNFKNHEKDSYFQIAFFLTNLALVNFIPVSSLFLLIKGINTKNENQKYGNFYNNGLDLFVLFIFKLGDFLFADNSFLEHSVTMLKGNIDFSANIFGFFKKISRNIANGKIMHDEKIFVFNQMCILNNIRKNTGLRKNLSKSLFFLEFSRKNLLDKKLTSKINLGRNNCNKFSLRSNQNYSNIFFKKQKNIFLRIKFEKFFLFFKIYQMNKLFSIENTAFISNLIKIFWQSEYFNKHEFFHFIFNLNFNNSYRTKGLRVRKLSNFSVIHYFSMIKIKNFDTCMNFYVKNFLSIFQNFQYNFGSEMLNLVFICIQNLTHSINWSSLFNSIFLLKQNEIFIKKLENNYFSRKSKNLFKNIKLLHQYTNLQISDFFFKVFKVEIFFSIEKMKNISDFFSKDSFVLGNYFKKKEFCMFLTIMIIKKKTPISSKIIFIENNKFIYKKFLSEKSFNFESIHLLSLCFIRNMMKDLTEVIEIFLLYKIVDFSIYGRSFMKNKDLMFSIYGLENISLLNVIMNSYLENDNFLYHDKMDIKKYIKFSNGFKKNELLKSYLNIKKTKKNMRRCKKNCVTGSKEEFLLFHQSLMTKLSDEFNLFSITDKFFSHRIFLSLLDSRKISKVYYRGFSDLFKISSNKLKFFY